MDAIPIYQVDAFAERPFEGNPAAVCFPPVGVGDAWLQRVAAEMNLSETAFLWREGDRGWGLRWLTPATEVDLCGHATLASAHVIWETDRADGDLTFHTRSGALIARRVDGGIELDFPATPPEPTDAPPGLLEALGLDASQVSSVQKTRFDYLVVLEDEAAVRAVRPTMRALAAIDVRGAMVTAPGDGEPDFVSRFFAPGAGVDEDPVTGSAHCALTPYWADALGRTTLRAHQASARGGDLEVALDGDRVRLRGRAVTVLEGTLRAPPNLA
ncbi:MAG TPA: PhzF family phenazine biosynthesis protein [Sandaracinaceae bacterium LLY-WYZ-13_1]|nr:PhzF family phenazine biosynthesis protein [Sandaracinaceae bacterium LLY-WYZ-13_1]